MFKATKGPLVATGNSFYSHLWPHKTYSKYWLMLSPYTPAQRDESSVQALGLTKANPRTGWWHHKAPRPVLFLSLLTMGAVVWPAAHPPTAMPFPHVTLKLRPQINPFSPLKLLLWGILSVIKVTDRTSPRVVQSLCSGSLSASWSLSVHQRQCIGVHSSFRRTSVASSSKQQNLLTHQEPEEN